MAKMRAPIDQLLESGRFAKKMLQEKGFEARKSVLDQIIKDKDAPILPGIPVYLPHRWTLKAARHLMYDILLMWREECEVYDDVGNPTDSFNRSKSEDIAQFWTFFIKILREQEEEYDREVANQPNLIKSLKDVPVIKDIFMPVRNRDNIKAIQRFFVDSFAVSIVLKNNHSTSEFANWFLSWAQDLDALWFKAKDRDKLPRI